jgi:beta-galactosidase
MMNKKRMTYFAMLAPVFAMMASAEPKPEWSNREVFEVNRLPAHAFTHRFPSVDSARPEPNWETPYHPDRYKLLSGTWKFNWSENPKSAPVDFQKANYNVKNWDDITVPLPWQLAGYGQLYYFNTTMPMVFDPRNGRGGETGKNELVNVRPSVVALKAAKEGWVPTEFNPVGCYVTDFTVPENWDKERVVLHFGAVKSAFYCWVNGKQVGYSQDSFTPSEFDITSLLKSGSNRLAVKVIRWSDGTYMENQDMIRMSGIIRDVYLYQTPETYIADFFLIPELSDDHTTGAVKLDVDLKKLDGATEPRTVEFELFNNQTGKRVLSKTAKSKAGKVQFNAEIANPDRWHVERPNLYTALITLKKGRQVEEVLRQDVGFKKLTWDKNGNTYLNGARYMMRGVNAHDTSERTGRTLSYDEMVKDVTTMRALNINSLRMAHYPKEIRYYALCNRYGIAVIDENNMESHGMDRIYADPEVEPLYRPQALFRMNNMVQRDKNMPSVIMWSFGNEQFPVHPKYDAEEFVDEVPTLRAMYDATKKTDPTRPSFAERTFQRGKDRNTHPSIEFIAPMYHGYKDYARWNESGQDRRPFFMCEYAHAMGNSMPSFKSTWDFFEAHPGMNGGFIWDFADQSILMEVEGQEGKHWTYGGDWGAFDSSGLFCNNGVVLPDRSYNGKSYQVRAVYQQVQFDPVETFGVAKIKNKFGIRNLNEFDFSWTLLENGNAVESSQVDFDLAPISETEFKAPFTYALKKGLRYDINYDVSLKADEFRGSKGSFVARGQISLQEKSEATATVAMPNGTPKTRTKGDQLMIDIAGESQVVFNRTTGLLEQLSVKGENILAPESDLPGIEFNPNICLMDDRTVWQSPQMKKDLAAGLDEFVRKNGKVSVVDSPAGSVRVKTECDYLVKGHPYGLHHVAYYTILSDGTIRVDNDVRKLDLHSNSLQMRIGARLPLKKEFDHVEYAALGPYENYDARNASARFGRFESNAEAMLGRYVRPQECGNRSGLEWISMQNAKGVGLVITSDSTGNGSVMGHTAQEMNGYRHQTALPESDRWILRYDAKLSAMNTEPNIDFSDHFPFSYTIRLLDGGETAETRAARGLPAGVKLDIPNVQKILIDGEMMELPWLSEKATVEYSSVSEKWTRFPDTLLTTQDSSFAFHTNTEKNPWLIVDLAGHHKIRALKIENRADSAMIRAKNMHVWVSSDKKSWKEVFVSVEAELEWTISVNPAQKARYVKIGLLGDRATFNLRGVKVYGEAE